MQNQVIGLKDMSTVTKGGRQSVKMIYKYDMKIVNREQEICKGLWTREQGKDKSVTDLLTADKNILEPQKGCTFIKLKNMQHLR